MSFILGVYHISATVVEDNTGQGGGRIIGLLQIWINRRKIISPMKNFAIESSRKPTTKVLLRTKVWH